MRTGDPSYADLDKLPYADACLREALRLFPPGASGAREAAEDQIVGGAFGIDLQYSCLSTRGL